jgi:signal transduction histidine kinase
MRVVGSRRKAVAVFLILGITMITLAIALNVGWILLNLQEIALLVFGIIFFALIITGLVLNTTYLIREIRRNEQQDAFLNAMTHELKTPIASIKLYLETLKARDVKEEKRREFYDIMLADSDRLLTTVEQVLQASRTREKSRKLNISKIEVGELLNDCAKLIRSRYNLKEDAIKVSEVPAETYISGDAGELRTVFGNLLDNAVKYSSSEVNVSVKTRIRQKGIVEIRIRDKGAGIPPNDLKRIFRRFYRVVNSSTQIAKGTGLGLYIVQSVIKKHGGKVFAKSKGEGFGSTFIVRLPKVS